MDVWDTKRCTNKAYKVNVVNRDVNGAANILMLANERTFDIPGARVRVEVVTRAPCGTQAITVATDKPGSLLLHWGYKQRALQTRFSPAADGGQAVSIELPGPEASDRLNFVIKNEGMGEWYDLNGANFQELCGVWAYLAWERAGCPARSGAEADAEYDAGVAELVLLLRRGVGLDELWAVARGQVPWAQFQAALGKPDGADFGADARRVLREQLAAGRSVQELEHALGASPPEASQTASQTGAPPASAPAPAQTSEESGLGASRGMRSVDPLDLIKRPAAAPLLADARPGAQDSPLAPLVRAAGEDDAVCWHRTFNLGDGAQLLATVRRLGDPHAPADDSPELMVELGSVLSMDGEELPLQRARVPVPVDADLAALAFVLRSRDGSRWWRDGGGDFRVPLPTGDGGGAGEGAPDAASGNPLLQDSVARAIVEAEATPAWTLMHRFNRASDLLEQVAAGGVEDVEGSLARIYVWLRYSSIRQLTWQRNYNTQPRILGAAQERLTHTIAKVYSKTSGMSQEWARLLLTTVGRGGNAQAVRDDILHIMHRNHIPEKGGTWMEQWHQKLHNNTTPDDVPICEAYLAFLESGGDQGTYWRVLADAGVTRQRLESFDRPITVDPQFFGDRRDALLADFRAYLKVLKAVHSGADLQASASAAARIVPAAAKAPLGYALAHAGTGGSALALVEAADWTVRLFAEEVVRAGPAFALSLALSAAEPGLRAAAELGAWQLVSPGAARGELVAVPSLREVQDRAFPRPTVLLAWEVTGEEEVPAGVVALLSPDAPDVLSHLAVRARNLAVLFAACHDAAPLRELEALEGRVLELDSTAAGAVTWQEADEEEVEGGGGRATPAGVAAGTKKLTRPTTPKWCGKWVLGMDEFKQGVVGAKSNNLAGLRGRLPESIQLPASVTIPFGSFEKALESRENRELAKQIRAAVSSVTPHSPGPALARCRDLVNQVAVPSALRKELEAGMRAAGIPVPQNEERWEAALCALKAVWASKYNDRAFYSCRKVGLRFDDVRMAVLCQRVVPVRYAFVIHTANPVSGDADEIYAELVIGLGEAIVSGAVPGSALAFSARKDALDAPRVLLYPSKSRALVVADSLILRSDSNGEDLEGYAGAGLYESVTVDATRSVVADYSADDLLMDPGFRRRLMTDVCRVGLEIEQALGSAQDIEGVVGKDGAITVVQTRPQV
ncbi:Alpha-glucan water dikinase, chloroplastic [Auxenochlorella protothecoides]|uniref:Alpha-glucan water dikinase, chloroplastic n=1 Tax=Auxenochlorella protothecoides TaxID=3075 RepID=A0A087SRY6_AUXPR|nr:Alpha-glucan water dikinase, chloroplastic [Auxenochlorella protothecoides]KFM28490.1 Alpha-glucan water dikinase, chloroplastic [Auxenochlorella protothecoides]